jgi:hypothetical protein
MTFIGRNDIGEMARVNKRNAMEPQMDADERGLNAKHSILICVHLRVSAVSNQR